MNDNRPNSTSSKTSAPLQSPGNEFDFSNQICRHLDEAISREKADDELEVSLRSLRGVALSHLSPRKRKSVGQIFISPNFILPSAGVAMAMSLVVALFAFLPVKHESMGWPSSELLIMEDEFEMFVDQDPEFYVWLESELEAS